MHDLNPVFNPGPSNIPDRIRNAMLAHTRDHRAPEHYRQTAKPIGNPQ